MANKPFDYTVINPLERPTSSDLNQLQGEAHADARAFMQRMFYDGAGTGTGSMEGFFPADFVVTETSPVSLTVDMSSGVGLQNGSAQLAIGGIAGLNDPYAYQVALNSAVKNIAIAALPTAGNHRYDLIQVRALSNTERLTDSTTTDIYNPSLNSFGGAARYKTLTTDLNSQTVQYVAVPGTAAQPVAYKIGTESLISAGAPVPPSPDTNYLPVALILVTDTTTAITNSEITDRRPILRLPQEIVPSNIADLGDPGSVVYSDGTQLKVTAAGSNGALLRSNGSAAPSWITTVPVNAGGTGFSSYTPGNLLYANGAASLTRLAPGSTSQILRGGTTPSWGTVPTGAFATDSIPVGARKYRSAYQTTFGSFSVTSTGFTQIAIITQDFELGNLQFGIMPQDAGAIMSIIAFGSTTNITVDVAIRYTVTGPSGFSKTYERAYLFPENGSTSTRAGVLTFETINCPLVNDGTYTITVSARVYAAGDSISLTNYQLRAWQG